VDDKVRTQLEEAAAAFRDAPKNLKAAIIEAARQGNTSAEIASAINLTYGPDYVSQIIRDAGVPRSRGRRKRATPDPD
jgi:hypothetical protein